MEGFSDHEAGSAIEACKNAPSEWLEIELVDDDDLPIPFVEYRVVQPDGKAVTGYLDQEGFARLDGIPGGMCQVTFTELDGPEWIFIESTKSKLMEG